MEEEKLNFDACFFKHVRIVRIFFKKMYGLYSFFSKNVQIVQICFENVRIFSKKMYGFLYGLFQKKVFATLYKIIVHLHVINIVITPISLKPELKCIYITL